MRQVVLFAIGFETTAPATALAIRTAKQKGWDHFSTLVSHVLVPPALHAIFSDPEHGIQGLLAAGHVCTITGYQDYFPIAERYRIPIAVTGFEPVDLLRGILNVIEQLEATPPSYRVDNLYEHVAMPLGNPQAQQVLSDVFEVSDQNWRGLGSLPKSGLHLRSDYAHLDALRRFPTSQPSSQLDSNAIDPNLNASILSHQSDCRTECQAADVLRGKLRPSQCPAFGTRCTPSNPLGAPMVSNEGACAAYYLYQPHSSEPNS